MKATAFWNVNLYKSYEVLNMKIWLTGEQFTDQKNCWKKSPDQVGEIIDEFYILKSILK